MQIGYYRCTKAVPYVEEHVGTIDYIYEFDSECAYSIHGAVIPLETFQASFEFVPDGFERRQSRILELNQHLHKVGQRQDEMTAKARLGLPSPTDIVEQQKDNVPSEEVQENSEKTSIVFGGRTPAQIKGQMKRVKTSLAFTKQVIARRSAELKALFEEQSAILRQKTEIFQREIKKTTEVLSILNAYMGSDEEIVPIQKGKKAPAGTPLSIRQRVLFMDEEVAAAKNWFGRNDFDYNDVKEFDKWFRDPKNLAQVLPEQKGVVAIRPRRKEKNYGDPFVNAKLNEKNKELYILVRNGESLWRIFTSLKLGSVLFPKANFAKKFLYKNNEPLTQGTKEYDEAVRDMESAQRRNYCVLMLIQGLIDRTKVFQPLPNFQFNVCNILQDNEHLKFIHDAENLLGDNRPSFNDWMKRVNSTVQLGSRVIGLWNSHNHKPSENRHSPACSYLPDNQDIYVLEKKEKGIGGGFVFLYQDRGRRKRSSFVVYPKDQFFLHYDEIKVEDVHYYMNSRAHRANYIDMMPMLKLIIDNKDKEQKMESEFSKLLVGEIMKTHKCSMGYAEEHIGDLVKWWKLKNKIHRALTKDDSKAIRMIVKEFGNRQTLYAQQQYMETTHRIMVDLLRKDDPQLLAIFHKRDNEYVSYSWMNDENIFVRIQHWTIDKKDEVTCVKDLSWKTVGSRQESWCRLWADDRWSEWKIGLISDDFLSDDELQKMILWAEGHAAQAKYRENECGKHWGKPLAIAAENREIKLYFMVRYAQIPSKDRSLTGNYNEPQMAVCNISFTKKDGKIEFKAGMSGGYSPDIRRSFGKDLTPKDRNSSKYVHRFTQYLHRWEDVIEEAIIDEQRYSDFHDSRDALQETYRPIEYQINDIVYELWLEKEHKKFLEEYEDDEEETFWQEYQITLKEDDRTWPHWIEELADAFVERNIAISGLTVEKFVEQGSKFIKKKVNPKSIRYYEKIKDVVLDTSYAEEGSKKRIKSNILMDGEISFRVDRDY